MEINLHGDRVRLAISEEFVAGSPACPEHWRYKLYFYAKTAGFDTEEVAMVVYSKEQISNEDWAVMEAGTAHAKQYVNRIALREEEPDEDIG